MTISEAKSAVVQVRDHALWIKHIDGNADLSARLEAMHPGATVRLVVAGIEGQWRKMAAGPGGVVTPGFRPEGAARSHWHELQGTRGAHVPIALSDGAYDPDPWPLSEAVSAAHEAIGSGIRVRLPEPVARIYEAVEDLEAAYPGRKFTPDGHLVGSIGEVVAAEALGLALHPASNPAHDAVDAEGRQVQIKLTSGRAVSLYACCERLVVLRIVSPIEAEVVYDGDGEPAWELAGPLQKNGQRVVSLAKLRRLMPSKD